MSEDFPPVLPALEREAMETVWRESEATVREVLDLLNARGEKPRACTTVLTILTRLDTKGMLGRRREKKTDVYTALPDVCRGFVPPTLTPSVLLLAATAVLIAATITRGAASAGRQRSPAAG